MLVPEFIRERVQDDDLSVVDQLFLPLVRTHHDECQAVAPESYAVRFPLAGSAVVQVAELVLLSRRCVG